MPSSRRLSTHWFRFSLIFACCLAVVGVYSGVSAEVTGSFEPDSGTLFIIFDPENPEEQSARLWISDKVVYLNGADIDNADTGEPVKGSDVQKIVIVGTSNKDITNLSEFDISKTEFVENIDVSLGDGDDTYMGGKDQGADVNVDMGSGDDLAQEMLDVMNEQEQERLNMLQMGEDDDAMFVYLTKNTRTNAASLDRAARAARGSAATVKVMDESGDDTLNFSEFPLPVTLDLDRQDQGQELFDGGELVSFTGVFENFVGSAQADRLTAGFIDQPRSLDGGQGGGTLRLIYYGQEPSQDGDVYSLEGYGDITAANWTEVELVNALEDRLGWYWDPEQSGHGVSLEAAEDPARFFLGWFTYDDGQPTWYIALPSETARADEYAGVLGRYTGWELGEPHGDFSPEIVGNVILSFPSSDAATLDFTLDGVSGSMNLERFMTRESYGGDKQPLGMSGWWKDVLWDGMGWYVEVRGESLYLVWYHYGPGGEPRWWVLGGGGDELADGDSYTGQLYECTGGNDPGEPYQGYTDAQAVGEATVTLNGDEIISFSYDGVTYTLTRAPF